MRVPYANELYHQGIKGQRWGVRRFQNEDRTWTAAGKARYGSGKIEKKARREREAIERVRRTAKTDEDIAREKEETARRNAERAERDQAKLDARRDKKEAKENAKAQKEMRKEAKEFEKKEIKKERLKKAAIIAGAAIAAYGGVKIYKNFKSGSSAVKGKEIFEGIVEGVGTLKVSPKVYQVIDVPLLPMK